VLEILNKSEEFQDLIQRVLHVVKQSTGCAAVGMRLESGDDFPYFAQNGFSDDFLLTENSLLGRNPTGDFCREPDGAVTLECICGMVISGNTDPSNPLFTSGGSFWTNDSSRLPDLLTGFFPRLHLRKRCIHGKYASIAIVPIRAMKSIVGLLQLNDHRKNRFSLDMIQAMENIVSHIGEAVMHHRTVEAMKKSEEIHSTILQTAMDGYVIVDMQGRFLEVNDTYCRMTGYSKADLLAMSVSDMEAIESFATTAARFANIKAHGEDRFEACHRSKDGSVINVEISVQYKPMDGGRMVAFIRDISRSKKDEERIHKLSQLLIDAQESERHLISCELHDSIAQNLSALKIGFNSLPFDPSISTFELREKQAWFARLLSQTINDVRNLAYDLRLPGLEEMGLLKALEIYCADASEKSKSKVNFHSAGLSKIEMGANMEIHIYRLIQEGWSNIRKHADADNADILLLGSYPNVILRIEDTGKGFDVKKQEFLSTSSKRMGIRSMQERVNMLQGQMTIQSQPMNGTKIMIKLPLPPNPGNAIKSDSES
jgi:PAS domain S-box-containing protein